ncbi:MAG: flagellar hook protein FlgE, partial [Campylobacteraceae bacterium]|nr:flagellar hook protein FlgE [Campylobacteraceae bacterium]
MMRSLWAGVSGLQAHQIAMDVEGNNIANVNTTGFKYSRANFSDLLSQTAKIATAPQGELGGKNSMQIGLGTQISSITKIFKQGSVQTTDKNTDLAIQGDGFFVVSPDGGSTYKYTRNGDFTFDALGNFTDSNGYIIQGWLRDENTNVIDATTPIRNITIPPGLTTPAKDTSYIVVKANLNSGNTITNKSSIYQLDEHHGWVDEDGNGIQNSLEIHNENGLSGADAKFDVNKNMYERGEDFGALFDTTGKSFGLSNGQGAWVSYTEARSAQTAISDSSMKIDFTINGVQISGSNTPSGTTSAEKREENSRYLQNLINQFSSETGVEATIGGGGITLINTNTNGTEEQMKNIKLNVNSVDNTGLISTEVITAFKYTYTPGSTSTASNRSDARQFRTTEDLRHAMQTDARLNTDYTGSGTADKNDGVTVTVNKSGQFVIANPEGDAFNSDDGDIVTATDAAGNPWTMASANLTIDGSFITANGTQDVNGESLLNVTLNGDYLVLAGVTGTYTVNGTSTVITVNPGDTIPAGSYSNMSLAGATVNLPNFSTYILTGTGQGALAN